MFIGESYRKMKDGRRYSYIVLAESVRTEKGPRQRVILSMGDIAIPKDLRAGFAERDVLLTQAEVFGRLIAPMSEYATVEWLQRTAMSDTLGKETGWIKKDALYRITNKRELIHKE